MWALYDVYSQCLRESEHMKPIKAALLYEAAGVLNYERDKAVKVLQSADDHYLKLCADKIKRNAPK